MSPTPTGWTVIIPLKATSRGKSRMRLPAELRQRLALAMAMDTVSAAASCASVLVMVEDETDGAEFAGMPGVVSSLTDAVGLNESIKAGLRYLEHRQGRPEIDPAGPAGVAVLPADLPSLRVDELAGALTACATRRFWVAADRQGTGTTLLAALDPSDLVPLYGPDSYRRHLAAGAWPVQLARDSSVRADVDTVADLAGGVGPHTRAVLLTVPALPASA